jgi:hypothetical protein
VISPLWAFAVPSGTVDAQGTTVQCRYGNAEFASDR